MKLLPLLCLLSPWFGPGSAQEIRPGVVTVAEDADALLPCSLGPEQKVEKFDWRKDNGEYEKKEVFFYERGSHYNNGRPGQDEQFKDRVLFFEDELKAGNASIKIKRTRLEDNGNYTCVLFEPGRQEFNIRLNVGAAREPHIKPVRPQNNWSLLECTVQGVPKPEVQWRDSAGEELTAKEIPIPESQFGRFHIKLQVNVTRSDNYSCVATQKDIFHQITSTFEVSIPDDVTVVEGSDSVLPCFLKSKENMKSVVFDWKKDNKEVFFYDRGRVEQDNQFKGRLSHFEAELKSGNASIKIHNTQMTDSGSYTCHFKDIQKCHIMLHVGKKPDSAYPTGLVLIVAIGTTILLLVAVIVIGVLCAKIHSMKDKTPGPECKSLNDTSSS